jgi:Tol biopolymer transport system component
VYQNTLYAAPMNLARLELTGQPQPVVENIAVSPKGDSAWYEVTQSGTLVFVPSQAAQIEKSIMRLTSGAEQPSLLLSGQASYSNVRFSPDGKRLLIAWEQNRITDIWIDDLARDAPSKLTFGTVVKIDPLWAPDGRYAFFFTRGGRGDGIAVVRTDGAGEMTQLLDGRPAMGGYAISPDGKTIVYAERGGDTGQDLWTLPIDLSGAAPKTTGQPEPFLRTPKDETNPAISPDGRWLAYVSNESGQNEVYVRPFPGGRDAAAGKRLASNGGGRAPVWSPKGHDLFYRNVSRQIMVTPYTISSDTFSVDKPRLWSSAPVVDFDVAPDGKSVAAIVDPPAGAGKSAPVEAVFLLNFFDELKRRVPPAK